MMTPGRGGKRPRFALLDELIGFDLVHVRIVGSSFTSRVRVKVL